MNTGQGGKTHLLVDVESSVSGEQHEGWGRKGIVLWQHNAAVVQASLKGGVRGAPQREVPLPGLFQLQEKQGRMQKNLYIFPKGLALPTASLVPHYTIKGGL